MMFFAGTASNPVANITLEGFQALKGFRRIFLFLFKEQGSSSFKATDPRLGTV